MSLVIPKRSNFVSRFPFVQENLQQIDEHQKKTFPPQIDYNHVLSLYIYKKEKQFAVEIPDNMLKMHIICRNYNFNHRSQLQICGTNGKKLMLSI